MDRNLTSPYTNNTTTCNTLSPRGKFLRVISFDGCSYQLKCYFDYKDVWIKDLELDSKSIIANNFAVKLSDIVLSKGFNATTSSDSNSYKVDTLDLTSSFTVGVNENSIVINASASKDDYSGIASYLYSHDNKNLVSSTSSSYTFTGLTEGTNYICKSY